MAEAPERAATTGPRTAEVMGVRFDALTEREAIARILDELDRGRGGSVVTPNVDHLRRCVRDPEYRALVAAADLVVADGMPIVWASRIAGEVLPERVAGSSLVLTLSRTAAERGRSVYLLGGDEGVAEGAARVFASRFPSLRIAGWWYPPFGFESDPGELARMERALAAAAPDIVFVGLGSPRQERLIGRLRPLVPRAWWLGVGISFSFVTGDVPRAPRWMQRAGLEWFHRLASEPRRLFRRYVIDGIPFAVRLLAWSVVRRFRR